MSGLLGKKIGMTQVFTEDGQVVPVTAIETGPCSVLQVKTVESDGYNALQLAFDSVKETRLKKPLRGKFKKLNISPKRFVKEIRVIDIKPYALGQDIDVSMFAPGEYVDVIGTSIGKGFQGGIKRWGWARGPETHGSMSHRAPGSIGASAYPSRVVKGHHLPGHMGCARITVHNLEVIRVDKENNLLVVKGSVPGHDNSYLIIHKSTRKKPKVAKKPAAEKKAAQQDKPKQQKVSKGKK